MTNAQKISTSQEPGLPAHAQVYQDLRDLILYGDIAPGEAVTIQGLTERLSVGMTPVREAIRRLIAEGALQFHGNRRVSVPRLTRANIDELIVARVALEPYLAGLSAKNANRDDLIALTEIDVALDQAIERGDVPGYLVHNYAFHAALYDLAQSPILRDLALGLWLRFGPSLRVVCGRFGTANLPDRHKEAIAALKAGDTDAAAAAIREDVFQGMEQIRFALDETDSKPRGD